MFLTDSKDDADKVRKWSTQSRERAPWYQHEELGYNYRMSNVIAGIIREQYYSQKSIQLKIELLCCSMLRLQLLVFINCSILYLFWDFKVSLPNNQICSHLNFGMNSGSRNFQHRFVSHPNQASLKFDLQ